MGLQCRNTSSCLASVKKDHEQATATMIELNDDDIEDFEFPDVIDFGSTIVDETIYRYKPYCAFTFRDDKAKVEDPDVSQSEKTRNWQNYQACSPVLDAWVRWNKSSEIKEEELCSFLNVRVASPSLQLVKSYLLGDHVRISVEDLKEVLLISDMLLLDDLADYCKYRIQRIDLNEENFLQILEVSSLYDFVHPKMKHFVMSHLQLLTEMEGSEVLTYDTVMFLLTDEVLTYWSMEERFHFITKWSKACVSRISLFSSLFSLIDLGCLEQEFMQSVIKTESLVRRSSQCLRRVEDALQQCMTSKLTPTIIIGDKIDEVCAFQLENKRSGNIPFLTDISSGYIVASAVLLPDCIILITNDDTKKQYDIVEYNMKTRETVSKELLILGRNVRIDKITQLHCQNDIAFFVGHDEFYVLKKIVKVKVRRKKGPIESQIISRIPVPFCTVYIKNKETIDAAIVLPLMSFKSKSMLMCIIKSRLLLKSRLDEHFYCFNRATYTLTKSIIPQTMFSSPLLSLLALDDTICAVFQSYIILFTFDENTAEMISTRKFDVDIGSDPFVTIATMEGTLVRVDNEYIHVCDSIQNSSLWKTYEFPDTIWSLSEKSVVWYGNLRKNIEMCHQDCPHCNTCFGQF